MLTNNQKKKGSCFKLSHRQEEAKTRSVLYRERKERKGQGRELKREKRGEREGIEGWTPGLPPIRSYD